MHLSDQHYIWKITAWRQDVPCSGLYARIDQGDRLAHGRLGLGQKHPDEHPGLPGPPDLGPVSARRPRRHEALGQPAGRPAQPQDRLRLPEFQPSAAYQRPGKRDPAAGVLSQSPDPRSRSSVPAICSIGSGWPTGCTIIPRSFPAAIITSRHRPRPDQPAVDPVADEPTETSTPRRAAKSSTCSGSSTPRIASRSCWSRTTRTCPSRPAGHSHQGRHDRRDERNEGCGPNPWNRDSRSNVASKHEVPATCTDCDPALRRNITRALLTSRHRHRQRRGDRLMETARTSSAIQRTITSMGSNTLLVMPARPAQRHQLGTARADPDRRRLRGHRPRVPQRPPGLGQRTPRSQVIYATATGCPSRSSHHPNTSTCATGRTWPKATPSASATSHASKVCLVGQTIKR